MEFSITPTLIDENDERDWIITARIDMRDRSDESAPFLSLVAIGD